MKIKQTCTNKLIQYIQCIPLSLSPPLSLYLSPLPLPSPFPPFPGLSLPTKTHLLDKLLSLPRNNRVLHTITETEWLTTIPFQKIISDQCVSCYDKW